MSRLNEMNKYLFQDEQTKNRVITLKKRTVGLAFIISFYAHRNQKRENGVNYYNHPLSCSGMYLQSLGLEEKHYYDDVDIKAIKESEYFVPVLLFL